MTSRTPVDPTSLPPARRPQHPPPAGRKRWTNLVQRWLAPGDRATDQPPLRGLLPLALLGFPMAAGQPAIALPAVALEAAALPAAALDASTLPPAAAPTTTLAQTLGATPQSDPRPRAQRTDATSPRALTAPAAASDTPARVGIDKPARLSDATFAARLRRDDLDGLDDLCRFSAAAGDNDRLTQLRQRLLERPMQPVTLSKILATADVLLSCRAPAAALTVLDRFSPDRGAGRVQWLLLQWRAANANLDHRLAARALERLAGGQSERLAGLELALSRPASGAHSASAATPPARRAAIDLLADHLEARGRPALAAERLLAAARLPVASGDTPARILQAERLHRAVSLLDNLPPAERERLLEPALEQAAAVGAWGLVVDMLDGQIRLGSSRALERRLRLSARLDDAYGEWRLRQQNPGDSRRRQSLEQRLRSPRDPGGHAPAPVGGAPTSAVTGVPIAPAAAELRPSAGTAPPPPFPPRPAMP
ncbi:MAG: hypothetical protein VKI42_06235 [Synechococcaceae cyanobacterium]|nr:hypothetical protein [Synechococcaceae cyanobacterium]